MVSDDVEIVTCRDGHGFRIRMTSVKSTYLLREIEQGDQLLDGIEPHGTRVTLRLRDTVDLTKRTVLDIVRHWVILPECAVEYQEAGQNPVRVGFASAAEALHNYRTSFQTEGSYSSNKYDIVVKSRRTSGGPGTTPKGTCELAIGVLSGYYPERSFALLERYAVPRVCIEGIRVAESLPGFGNAQSGGISALLSVRGSRTFRTTVSRSGLEVDDEYDNIAKLCGDMLFDHIRDEA
jgi:hypothetical protein